MVITDRVWAMLDKETTRVSLSYPLVTTSELTTLDRGIVLNPKSLGARGYLPSRPMVSLL